MNFFRGNSCLHSTLPVAMSPATSSLSARIYGWRKFRAAIFLFCGFSLGWAEDAPTSKSGQPARTMSSRGYLGVTLTEICPEVRAQTTLKDGEGLMVGRVAPDSPAFAHGLVHYDILTKFNDQWIMSPAQFITLVENAGPGSAVELTLLRRGAVTTAKVTLGAPPAVSPSVHLAPLPEEMLTSVIRLLRDNPVELETVHRMLHSARNGVDVVESPLRHGSRVTLHDDNGEVEITVVDGQQKVRAWDKDGQLLFEGPCNTPAEHSVVPEALRSRVERLLRECRNPAERRPAPVKAVPLPVVPSE